MPIPVIENVELTDTFDVWRQKTNQAIEAIDDLAIEIASVSALGSQFVNVPTPNAVGTLTITTGNLRNKNEVQILDETIVPVSDGDAETFTGNSIQNIFNTTLFTVLDNDPEVAVFVDNVLQTSGYTITAPDIIEFAFPPLIGTAISALKRKTEIIAIDGSTIFATVDLFAEGAVPLNNHVPLYRTVSLKYEGFTGVVLPVWGGLLSDGTNVSSVALNGVAVDTADYVVSVADGTITFLTALVLADAVDVYATKNDLRTWAVAAVDVISDLNPTKIEWSDTLLADATVITTTIPDTYIGHISVYVDELRKTDALGSEDYTTNAVGGFVEVTFTNPVLTGQKVLVVANQDDHVVTVPAIIVEFPSNPTPNDVFDFTATALEGYVNVAHEGDIAVYVGGLRKGTGDYTITNINEITLTTPVTSTHVMFVANEANGLDGTAALELNGGLAGYILYKLNGGTAEWRVASFPASAITSGTISISRLPVATTEEVFVGVATDKVVVPRDVALRRYKETLSRWLPCEVGKRSDFIPTNISTYPAKLFGNKVGYLMGTRDGRIFCNPEDNTEFATKLIYNAPFPLNWISAEYATSGMVSSGLGNLAVIAGDNGKIARKATSNLLNPAIAWTDITLPSGIDTTWKCLQVEAQYHYQNQTLTNARWGTTGATASQTYAYLFVFENADKTEYRVYATFKQFFSGTMYWRLLDTTATKPVIKSHVLVQKLQTAGQERIPRIAWCVGNVYKYFKYTAGAANTGLDAAAASTVTFTEIAGENIVDFWTWNTRELNTANSEPTNSGNQYTFGVVITDKGSIGVSVQSNGGALTLYDVTGGGFLSPFDTIIKNLDNSSVNVGVIHNSTYARDLGRRIIGVSADGLPATTTRNDNTFVLKEVGLGSAFSLPIAKFLTSPYLSFFGDVDDITVGDVDKYLAQLPRGFLFNEQADMANVFADEGNVKTTNHTIAVSGATKAFTSDKSPALPTALKKVVSNGLITIAAAKHPMDCIWVLTESNQGGTVVPFTENIIDIFCEGEQNFNRFFVMTTTKIYYSTDGLSWQSNTHGVVIGGGNGCYEMSAAREDIAGPSTKNHYIAIVDGTLLCSRSNAYGWTTLAAWTSIDAGNKYIDSSSRHVGQRMFLLRDTDKFVYSVTYLELNNVSPSITLSFNQTTKTIQCSNILPSRPFAIRPDGTLYMLNVTWQLQSPTLAGIPIANFGNDVVKMCGRKTLIIKTSVGKYYASANGVDWVDFILPFSDVSNIGDFSHNGNSYFFITETSINNPNGKLPTYYRAVV